MKMLIDPNTGKAKRRGLRKAVRKKKCVIT